jgi:DNA-binding transcriptional regulator YhcF (GntR family)
MNTVSGTDVAQVDNSNNGYLLARPQSTFHRGKRVSDEAEGREAFEIVPIKRIDVYESVLARSNALITESGMKPGDRELVEKLAMGRVSVREALRALESMGKIEIRRNAGSFVVNPNGSGFASQLKATHPVGRTIDKAMPVRARSRERRGAPRMSEQRFHSGLTPAAGCTSAWTTRRGG